MKFNKTIGDRRTSAFAKYRHVCYGTTSLPDVIFAELILMLSNSLPGAAGFWLRGKLYRQLFGAVGKGVVFGRNMTLRHPHKIRIGDHVVIDDNVVLDAKGDHNQGITIGDNVYIGRNTIVYCKDGDIVIRSKANISSNCQLFSSNRLEVGAGTVVGAFSYFLSGGNYDSTSAIPFADQEVHPSKGPLLIGANSWIGAHVTITDASTIGEHCIVGAGAVVNRPIPPNSVAVGVPARVVKSVPACESTHE
jgi:acetyltransferase-like isoleucine patch superfamily enzyme